MKKILKIIGYVILTIAAFLLLLIGFGFISNYYEYNIKYSIAMPTILGRFNVNNDFIQISGLNKIVNDDIANLVYSEFSCIPSRSYCAENRFGIMRLGNQINIFPYHYEYEIKYIDENKLLFEEDSRTSGEIDFNSKTLFFTVKNAGFNNNETRKIEIITDNKKIEELEKKIILKYLKVK